MSNQQELAAAAIDPWGPPWWYFAVLGAAVALGLTLMRVHYLFFFFASLAFVAFAVVRQWKAYVGQ